MNDFQLTVKIDSFNEAMAAMSEKLRGTATKEEIIRNEVQQILQKTLKGTATATKGSIYQSQASYPWRTYQLDGSGFKKKYYLLNRYPDAVWAQIQNRMAESLARKTLAAGWSRKSWYELGLFIERPIDGLGSENAVVKGRDASADVSAHTESSDTNFVLFVSNASPLMNFTGGRQAFFGAIASRSNYFRQNLAHGVFNDLAQVASKYPGLHVSQVDMAA